METFEFAENVERFIDEQMTDSVGRIFSQIDASTLKMMTEEFFKDAKMADWIAPAVKQYSLPGFHAYENVGMVTGAYLQSLVYKYRISPSPGLLERIQKKVDALLYIAELGRQLEWGFFPKCYDGGFSAETSTDQVLSCVSALDLAYNLVPSTVQAKITDFIVHAVEFWRKRDYCYSYWTLKDMRWPELRFPPLLYLEAKYSGDAAVLAEADAITEKNLAHIPENSKILNSKRTEFEKKNHCLLLWAYGDACSMDTLNADLVLRSTPGSRFEEFWRKSMVTIWKEGELTLTDDGNYYAMALLDLKTGQVSRTNTSQFFDWYGYRSAWSTMIVRGGLLASMWNPWERNGIMKKAKEVLDKFTDVRQFNYRHPDDAVLLPPAGRYTTRFLSGDSITNFLWSVRLIQYLEA
ncbi:MAG: hypothetical protein J6X55_15870 [Victivallales bacterium]|nr:hypothetical protein [Victivallales bacterium]